MKPFSVESMPTPGWTLRLMTLPDMSTWWSMSTNVRIRDRSPSA